MGQAGGPTGSRQSSDSFWVAFTEQVNTALTQTVSEAGARSSPANTLDSGLQTVTPFACRLVASQPVHIPWMFQAHQTSQGSRLAGFANRCLPCGAAAGGTGAFQCPGSALEKKAEHQQLNGLNAMCWFTYEECRVSGATVPASRGKSEAESWQVENSTLIRGARRWENLGPGPSYPGKSSPFAVLAPVSVSRPSDTIKRLGQPSK